MKLLYCPECDDVVRLFPERRACRCGKSWGNYLEDNSTTVQTWPSLSLGIANPDFHEAMRVFAADPVAFTAALTMRSWINPVSEPDVTFVIEKAETTEPDSSPTASGSPDVPPE